MNGFKTVTTMSNTKDMEQRRLLYCELTIDEESEEYVKNCVRSAVNTMDFLGALEHFRKKPDKPYLIWQSYSVPKTVAFTLRLKTPWNIDEVFYHLTAIKCAHVTGLSWVPSRESYGGTVQQDGSVIETWDI